MGVIPPVGKEDPASVEGESVIINREESAWRAPPADVTVVVTEVESEGGRVRHESIGRRPGAGWWDVRRSRSQWAALGLEPIGRS